MFFKREKKEEKPIEEIRPEDWRADSLLGMFRDAGKALEQIADDQQTMVDSLEDMNAGLGRVNHSLERLNDQLIESNQRIADTLQGKPKREERNVTPPKPQRVKRLITNLKPFVIEEGSMS